MRNPECGSQTIGLMIQHGSAILLGGLLVLGCATTSQGEVRLGSEVLAAGGFRELQGKRVGLITNPSGVNRRGESTVTLLHRAPGVKLTALLAPEHGLYGTTRAGAQVADGKDTRTGLPVHSLYGATRKPTPAMLRGLDALVYDLQDTGARSYTFISTMGLAMEACGEAGLDFIVLDRPNPLGGERVEGPMLEDKFRSFIGLYNIPYVYGMTCGELAQMINREGWMRQRCRLTVIRMTGWRRSMVWNDTRLTWVPTSPNVPRGQSCFGYAALGLLGEIAGGSGLSIGGAIGRPFECVTAPWLDATRLSRELDRAGLPGIRFPSFSATRDGKKFRGVELYFTKPATAPLVAINFHMLDAVRKVSGRNLLLEATRSQRDFSLFDKACGSDRIRQSLLTGGSASEIVSSWKPGEDQFRRKRQPYLLYDGPTALPAVPSVRQPVSPPPEAAGQKAPPPAKAYTLIVTVAPGDTVSKIARHFGVTVSAIAEANPGLNVDKLKVGQTLRIPRR